MTIQQLINILSKYEPNAIVRTLGCDEQDNFSFEPISSSLCWTDEDGTTYIDL